MKTFICLIGLLFFQNGFAQSLTDTLYFGNKKFPLQKTKINYDGWQPGVVDLPVEYTKLKKEVSIPYRLFSDTSYAFAKYQSNNYIVTVPEKRCTKDDHQIKLYSFVDTIKIKITDLKNLRPYIVSNHKKVFFCSVSLIHNLRDTLTEYRSGRTSGGEIFSFTDFFDSAYYHKLWKNSTFIITELYYQKGNATYYLDRNFIIICEQ